MSIAQKCLIAFAVIVAVVAVLTYPHDAGCVDDYDCSDEEFCSDQDLCKPLPCGPGTMVVDRMCVPKDAAFLSTPDFISVTLNGEPLPLTVLPWPDLSDTRFDDPVPSEEQIKGWEKEYQDIHDPCLNPLLNPLDPTACERQFIRRQK